MVQRPGNETFAPEVIETTNEKFASQKESLVRPFKLEKGRLLRVAIYVTEDKKYLFTDFHHIIADGNSYDIIFEDINKAYMGEKLEKESYTGFDAALDEEQQMKECKYKKAEKYYDSIARSWALPRIFYLQVCSASLWQNTPMQRTACFPLFIMDETIPGLKTRSACW